MKSFHTYLCLEYDHEKLCIKKTQVYQLKILEMYILQYFEP